MPHLILEHSAELAEQHDINALVHALFDAAVKSGVFGAEDIRARSVACENSVVGAAKPGFAHLVVRMMAGRPEELRLALAEDLLAVMLKHLPDVGALSVAPEDIKRETYARRVLKKEQDNG